MFRLGDRVRFEGREFTVLGFAASEDEWGEKLVEIAWSDYSVSSSGYLAVPEIDLVNISYKGVSFKMIDRHTVEVNGDVETLIVNGKTIKV